MYKGDLVALEDIDNYSICALTCIGIRKMKYDEDIERELVYVNNIPKLSDGEYFTVKKGEYVRYMPISVVPKVAR